MIGQTISHYKILEKLGEGGMGVVYKAQDTTLDRLVALKFLPPHVSVSDDVKARFLQEAKAAAALNHPNICTIYGVGEHDGHFFIAMELIEGGTLRETILKRQFSIEKYSELGIQIGEALQQAHAKDIVHRDIKSENIMLTAAGQTKIMDFGLAKLKGSLKLTKTSSTVGTLGYMAPEQIQGGQVDHRSDIFSFGVLLFEMFTGKMPFRGEHEAAMVYSIVNEEPTNVSQIIPSISPIIVNLISRCLEKDPSDRYQSMEDAVIELRRSLKQTSKVHRASAIQSSTDAFDASVRATGLDGARREEGSDGSSKRVSWKLAGGIAAIIVLAIVSYVLFWAGSDRLTYNMNAMEIERLPVEGTVRALGLSPDGQYAMYLMEENELRSIQAKHLSSGSTVEVLPPTSEVVRSIEFGGSSTHFFFLARDVQDQTSWVLKSMPVLGGPIRTHRTFSDGIFMDYSLSYDGDRIAFTRILEETGDFSLMVSDIDGSNEQILATDNGPKWYQNRPSWSPDGTTILSPWGTTIGGWRNTVLAVNVGTGEARDFIDRAWVTVNIVRWLPDGKGFLVLGNETRTSNEQIWEVSYPDGESKRFTNDINNYGEVEATADGSILGTISYTVNYKISILDAPSMKELYAHTSSTRDGESGLSWTPDGKILFTSVTDKAAKIWVMDIDGSGKTQLTFGEDSDMDVTISRDGQDITFISDRSGTPLVWRARVDGANVRQVSQGSEHYDPIFSPDKEWIYHSSWDYGPSSIVKTPAAGGESIRLSTRSGENPRLSTDGSSILYHGSDSAYIMPIGGGEPIFSIPRAKRENFNWRPGSNSITFFQNQGNISELWEAFLDGRPARRLLSISDSRVNDLRWSFDGKKLAILTNEVSTNIVLFKQRKEVSE